MGPDPTGRHIANIYVAMQAFLEFPDGPLQLFSPLWIGQIAIIGTGRAIKRQETPPVIVVAPVKKRAIIRILHNNSFVEPPLSSYWPQMHFADIDAPVARIGKIFYPVAMVRPCVKRVDAGVMRIHAGKNRRPRSHARSTGTVGSPEGEAFRREAVHMRGRHMRTFPSTDRIDPLLVRHNEDYVWLFSLRAHVDSYLMRSQSIRSLLSILGHQNFSINSTTKRVPSS